MSQAPPPSSLSPSTQRSWWMPGDLGPHVSPFPVSPTDFFQGKHFFLYGEFPGDERRKLIRYVTAFNGSVAGLVVGPWASWQLDCSGYGLWKDGVGVPSRVSTGFRVQVLALATVLCGPGGLAALPSPSERVSTVGVAGVTCQGCCVGGAGLTGSPRGQRSSNKPGSKTKPKAVKQ